MKYKHLKDLNEYVIANNWELVVEEEFSSIHVFKDEEEVVASVRGYLVIDTGTIEFEELTDNQKRTLFEKLLRVALIEDEERFEIEEEEE